MISERSTVRLQVGHVNGCFRREWHTLWSWLKLMRSPRAAANRRTGTDTNPNVRWPFQTLVAINSSSRSYRRSVRGQDVRLVASPAGCNTNDADILRK